MTKLFKQIELVQQIDALAKFLPEGSAFMSKFIDGSNFRNLLTGFSYEAARIYESMNNLSEDYDLDVTDELLERWESAVGIPDHCFPGNGTKAERRLHVLIKFAKMNVQTHDDFIELAELLGFTDVTITPYQELSFPPYDVPFIPIKAPESRFLVKVTGTDVAGNVPPYDVPFTPGGGASEILQCIFDICRPANTIFRYFNLE